MRHTALAATLAAQMMLIAGTALAQHNDPMRPGEPSTQPDKNAPAATPSNPHEAQPGQPGERWSDADREKIEKEWTALKKEWDALTPEQRTLSVLRVKNAKEVELGRLGQERGTSQGVKDFGAAMVRDHNENNQRLASLIASENITLWDNAKTERALMLKKMYHKDGKDKDGKDWNNKPDGDRREDEKRDGDRRKDKDRPADASNPQPGGQPTLRPTPSDPNYPGKADKDWGKKHDPMAKLRTLSGDEFDRAYAYHMHKGHEELLTMLEKSNAELTNANVKAFATETANTVRNHRNDAARLPGALDKPKDHDMKDRDRRDPRPGQVPGSTPPARVPGDANPDPRTSPK